MGLEKCGASEERGLFQGQYRAVDGSFFLARGAVRGRAVAKASSSTHRRRLWACLSPIVRRLPKERSAGGHMLERLAVCFHAFLVTATIHIWVLGEALQRAAPVYKA
jgi:hypothetical protein